MRTDSLTPFTFETQERDQAHQYLRDTYAAHQVASSGPSPNFQCHDVVYQLGEVLLGRLVYTGPVELALPQGVHRPFILTRSANDSSPWMFQLEADRQRCDSRQPSIQLSTNAGYSVTYDSMRAEVVALSGRLLADDASARSEMPLELGFRTSVSGQADPATGSKC